jgi:hypothetical protein
MLHVYDLTFLLLRRDVCYLRFKLMVQVVSVDRPVGWVQEANLTILLRLLV